MTFDRSAMVIFETERSENVEEEVHLVLIFLHKCSSLLVALMVMVLNRSAVAGKL